MQNASAKNIRIPLFVRGDIDGFFGLALDNLVQLLVLTGLCRVVLGFSDALILGPHPAGRGGFAAGRQSVLRMAGAASRERARDVMMSAHCPTASIRSRYSRSCSW